MDDKLHESLDVEMLENSFSALLLQFKELIRERDVELNEVKQELLSSKNHNKRLKVENDKLKDENIALRDRIDNSVLQSDNFNEDCLLEIFSYLSMDDMIQVKKVCRKWYNVSQQWSKQVQTLVCRQECYGIIKLELYEKYYKRKIYEKNETSSFDDLFSILHSWGHHIKYIQLGYTTEFDRSPTDKQREEFMLQWVPKLCKNIVEIQIKHWSITKLNLMVLATHWKKLKKIDIENNYFYLSVGEIFFELLRNNKQLKILKLNFEFSSEYRMTGKLFTYLPTTIEGIFIGNISFGNKKEVNDFISASKNFTSLQSIKFSYVRELNDAAATAIADIRSLTHLTLIDVFTWESCRTIDLFSNMKGLKSLYLMENEVLLEDSVINIVENCKQLEVLFIHCCGELTDRTLAAIAKLEKLKCLHIDMSNMTIESIINLCGNLEVLGCINSITNNSDAITLLEKGTNLKFVDFGWTGTLSKDVLQEANEMSNERKNKILYITGYFDSEDIDTPYFKYVRNIKKIPQEVKIIPL